MLNVYSSEFPYWCIPCSFVSLILCFYCFQAPSEYEANPEVLFYRITHLTRGQQYLIWAAAVTTAGRGNISEKVTVEPAGKGEPPMWLTVEKQITSRRPQGYLTPLLYVNSFDRIYLQYITSSLALSVHEKAKASVS